VTRVVVSDHAEADLLAAFEFHEDQREALGVRFREHVDFAIARIQLAPERCPIVYRDLRRRLVERFPTQSFTGSIPMSRLSSR